MGFGVLDTKETENGLSVTFISATGLHPLEGTREEFGRLAEVMRQVAALAPLNDTGERVWLDEVVVGGARVKLGLDRGGHARMEIIRG